jgi:hypothetical protein
MLDCVSTSKPPNKVQVSTRRLYTMALRLSSRAVEPFRGLRPFRHTPTVPLSKGAFTRESNADRTNRASGGQRQTLCGINTLYSSSPMTETKPGFHKPRWICNSV